MSSHAMVSAVCGSNGGVGVTSVSVQLALATAATMGSTLLLDLDVQKGGMAAKVLGLRADAGLSSCLADDAFAGIVRVQPGIDLVSAPTDLAAAVRVGHTDVSRLIAAWRTRYAHIIIDMGNYLNMAGISALSMAHAVWLVTTEEAAVFDCAVTMLGRLAALGMPLRRIELVVNRARPPLDLPDVGVEIHAVPDDASMSFIETSSRYKPAVGLIAERLSSAYKNNVAPTRTGSQCGRAGERLAT